MQKRLTVIFAILLISIATYAAAQNYYNTFFPATQNPISETGNWISGSAAGTNCSGFTGQCWGDVQTTPGLAFGTNTGPNCGGQVGQQCDDSTAVLAGTWAANQAACATVFISGSLNRSHVNESEIRLNTTISSQSITGYEFTYSMQNGGQYAGFVRWNGPLGQFSVFAGAPSPSVLTSGDTVCASHVGGTLKAWLIHAGTSTVITSVADTSIGGTVYTNGSPGIGFDNLNNAGDNGLYGWSQFTATNLAAQSANQTDVNTLIAGPLHTIADGESLLMPPCPINTCAWAAGITISGKGVQIYGSGTQDTGSVCTNISQAGCGSGVPTTIITDNAGGSSLFVFRPTFGSSLSRLSTLNLIPGTTSAVPISFGGTCTASGCPNVRLDNTTTTNWFGLGIAGNSYVYAANVWGVFDHNHVSYANVTSGSAPTFVDIGHGHWMGVGNWGDNSWAGASTFGTQQELYLENNIIDGVVGTDAEIFDGVGTWGGGRYVCRFNYFPQINVNGACTGHGTDTTGRPRGTRQWEAYGNYLVCANASQGCNSAWPGRAGVGRSFGNTVIQSGGSFKGLGGPDTQRQYRPDSPWLGCDGLGPFDTNDGVIYYSGVVGAVSGYGLGAPGGTITDASFPGLTNTIGARYSFVDTTQPSFGFPLSSVAPGVLNIAVGNEFSTPAVNDHYTIQRATVCLDQTGHSGGILVQDSSDTNQVAVLSTTLAPGPVNQSIDPVYEANDSMVGTSATHTYSAGGNVIPDRDIFSEGVNQPANSSPTFPFSGVSIQQPVSSWSCNSTTCTWNVPSTTGFAVNGYVNVFDTAAGATNHRTNNNPAQITALTSTSVTGSVPGVFPDTGGAGGALFSIGAGHGSLANRPTCASGCITGAGYFATDQGTWNTVDSTKNGLWFKWNGSSWVSEPVLTYPHPLITQAPGVVSVSPSSENFGSSLVGNSTAPQTATLTNGTAASITISSVTTTGNTADFPNTANTCTNGFVVAANGGQCQVSTKFLPTTTGSRSATLTIATSAGSFPVALSGIGGSNTTNPPSCIPTGGIVPQTVTCTNPNPGATIMCYASSPTVPATNGLGTACSSGTAYTTQLAISSAETLEVIAGVAGQSDSSISSYTYTAPAPNCPSPTSVGQFTFCSEAYSVVNGTSVSVNLSPFAGNGVELFVSFCASSCGAPPPAITLTVADNINNPETCFVKSPHSPYTFNNSAVPDSETFYVLYCPSVPSGVTSFTASSGGVTLGSFQLDAVEWKVGSIASANYFENVDNITSSGSTAGTTATVLTSGPTVNPNDLITALTVDCGLVNASVGTGYTGIIVNPANTAGHILEARGVTSIQSPNASATMSWSSGTPFGNCGLGQPAPNDTWFGVVVPLVGGAVTITPANLNFGSVTVGQPSAGQVSTVVNNTASAITVSTINYTGTNNLDFSTFATTCGTVPANGGSCTITTKFTPGAVGPRSATLNFAFTGASGSPLTVALSGTGGAPQVGSCTETQTTTPNVGINIGRHVGESENNSTNDATQAVKPSGICHAIP